LVLREQGKYEEAEQMQREVMGIRQKVLGMEHPSTQTSMGYLSLGAGEQGKYVKARLSVGCCVEKLVCVSAI
jgi:Tetratricopeptide repeat